MKTKKIKIKVDLDKALGRSHRERYLEMNPNGFKKVLKVHKSKKKYSRKIKFK